MKSLNVIDMFCGGGGESTGLVAAAHEYGFEINLSAINHWERAVETHSRNYPWAEHRCRNVQDVEPTSLRASENTDLLWASLRSPAWEVIRFTEELRPKRVIIENVPEFRTWGPLDAEGNVIRECKGKTFRAFITGLRSLNYTVDWRILCAADYGAPTSRRRLFIQAVRKDCGKHVLWPEPTNTQGGDLILPDWHPAKEIINWELPCQIISRRKKPLAEATVKRIECGIRKFWGDAAVPFIARLYGMSTAESIEKPLSTISCSGAHHMLITPVPGPAVQPLLVQYYGNGHAIPVTVPVPTLTTKDRYAVIGTDGNGFELGYRMLQPEELAAATGFPKEYRFTGNKSEIVKQIGNAVPPDFARALFARVLRETAA